MDFDYGGRSISTLEGFVSGVIFSYNFGSSGSYCSSNILFLLFDRLLTGVLMGSCTVI
jgi:hypothetical protein